MLKFWLRLIGLGWFATSLMMGVWVAVAHTVHTPMIAFTSDRNGTNHEIYALDVNLGVVAQLTHNGNTNTAPDWSLDGSTLAWLQGGADATFWAIRMGNYQPYPFTNLLISAPNIAWSPTSATFLFERTASNGWKNIILMNADTGEMTNLTDANQLHEASPSWAPDGQQFVFSFRDNIGNDRIAIYNFRTQETTQLTDEASVYPSWSPDGNTIAFINTRGNNPKLTLMNPDKSNIRVLNTDYPINYAPPEWSPNSEWLAFGLNSGDVMLYHVADGALESVTPPNTYDLAPVFSPDGRYLAVVENNDKRPQTRIILVDLQTKARHQVTFGASFSSDRMPSWRP